MRLRVVSWNLKATALGDRPAAQVALLSQLGEAEATVFALQEVSPEHHAALTTAFPASSYAGSLDLRPPRRYEGGNRKLGCAIAVSSDLSLGERLLVPDTPLPERTLVAKVHAGGTAFQAGSFHAITGVGYKKAKPLMFQAMTRFLEDRSLPTVFGIDRNAPKVDRWPLSASQWWWPRLNEEPLLFGDEAPHDCRDAFLTYLATHPEALARVQAERPDGPLAVTHLRGPSKVPCRYDAVYVSPEWRVASVVHRFDGAIRALSDHAIVLAEVDLVLGG
jgi:endonuclease/exonuclease/phosphatase family metal-dependent hydrolase